MTQNILSETLQVGVNARTFTVESPGGAVQVGLNLTRKLISDPKTETQLYGHSALQEKFGEVEVHSNWYPFDSQLYGLVWEKSILPFFNLDEIDILFCPNGNGPLFDIDPFVVMYIHDVNAMRGLSDRLYGWYRKIVIPRAARTADAVVTVSKFSKNEIHDLIGIPTNKIHVVHNGLDPIYIDDICGKRREVPERYILYVGQLNPRKNVDRLIEGFKCFNGDDGDYKLVLVGPGNKRIFEDISIEQNDNIIHMGYLGKKELKYTYDNADLFLFPSLHEGFGLPPLEAMACGVPVVASRNGALPEILEEYPMYVDSNSKIDIARGISSVLVDNEYTVQRRKEAKKHAQGFTWQSALNDLKKTLNIVTS